MKELEEQCVCVCEILLQNWYTFTETFQLLNQAYGEDCTSLDLNQKKYR